MARRPIMRRHTSVMLGLVVLLAAGVAVWAAGPLEQLKPGEVVIHEKRPGDVIIEGVPGEKIRITFQIPGREHKKLVVKPLANGRLMVTDDEEIPIDRRSQGVTLFLNKVSH
jgi:hypothetical protein